MKITAQDFYCLFCDPKCRRITETIHEGYSGMYYVLRILSESDKELSAGDISETFGVTTARTAVVLKTLEKKGLITKSKSSADARKTIVKLTQEGEAVLATRKARIFEVINRALSKLDENERQDFYSLICKLISD